MKYKQRDVVKAEMETPDGVSKVHPFVIISCRSASANEKDGYYTAVMMTSNKSDDRFSFHVEQAMFEGHLEKTPCQFRLHIIVSFPERNISSIMTTMNKVHFSAMMKQIKDYVLAID